MEDWISDDRHLRDLELDLLLEGLHRHYGYDFRDYARPSLARRVQKALIDGGVKSISGLQEQVLHDPNRMEQFLKTLSVTVTSMFRNPLFYVAFRRKVAPMLHTYPFVRIWHAGCSTGEEVYSMAILLREEGLYERCRIYATDISNSVLQKAKEGIFPLASMRTYTSNYQKSGGKADFSAYYTAKYESAIVSQDLKKNLVFAQHNLAADGSFNEFHVIVCRNVMIYFNRALQSRVHRLFHESLCPLGVLGLGEKELLLGSPHADCYEELDGDQRLYRRVK